MFKIISSLKRFNREIFLIFLSCLIGFGLLLTLSTELIDDFYGSGEISSRVKKALDLESLSKKNLLEEYIESEKSFLFAILNNQITEKFIRNPKNVEKDNLSQFLYGLVDSTPLVLDVTILDSKGIEILKVKRDGLKGGIDIIEIQEPSNQIFFKEIRRNNGSEVWHSNIELYMKDGEIESPVKSLLHAGIPIFFEGSFKGTIIVSFKFDKIINQLSSSTNFDIYLCDNFGESIFSPVENGSWSRYLSSGKSTKSIFSKEIDRILLLDEYQTDNLWSYDLGNYINNSEGLKIIFLPKESHLALADKNGRYVIIMVILIVIIASVILSLFLSSIPSQILFDLSSTKQELNEQSDIVNSYVMLTEADLDGKIVKVSERFLRVTGYNEDDILGNTHAILKHLDTPIELHRAMAEKYKNGYIWSGEIKDRKKNGSDLSINLTIKPKIDVSGNIVSFIGLSEDLSDKKIIEDLTVKDILTGLYNRKMVESVFKRDIALNNRFKTTFGVIILGIDDLKRVNRDFGYLIGDSILIELSKILTANSREVDYICRWGGDEFVIISSNQELGGAYHFAEKIRALTEKSDFKDAGNITISGGVVTYLESESVSEVISRAYKALYIAKESGKNRIVKG